MSYLEELQKLVSKTIRVNELFANISSIHVGGIINAFVSTTTENELVQVIKFLSKNKINYIVMGGASNMIISDDGFSGVLVQTLQDKIQIENQLVYAEAGVVTAVFASKVAQANLSGFEWAIGIPGRIGGAIYGNSGAMGNEINDVIDIVRAIDYKTLEVKEIKCSECNFGYRESVFKKTHDIILGARFKFTQGNFIESSEKMKQFLNYRSVTQPKGFSSCGCMFKNYEFKIDEIEKLRACGIPEAQLAKGKISSGWLIEHANAKGFKIGGAAVSDVHANFVVNNGFATAKDIKELVQKVKTRVAERFGVQLKEEVQFIY